MKIKAILIRQDIHAILSTGIFKNFAITSVNESFANESSTQHWGQSLSTKCCWQDFAFGNDQLQFWCHLKFVPPKDSQTLTSIDIHVNMLSYFCLLHMSLVYGCHISSSSLRIRKNAPLPNNHRTWTSEHRLGRQGGGPFWKQCSKRRRMYLRKYDTSPPHCEMKRSRSPYIHSWMIGL